MQVQAPTTATELFSRCIANSRRVRWSIDEDVIRGRTFDDRQKFLPDGLSKVDEIDCLSAEEKRYLSRIQGRTYANVFGLVERFINAKVLEVSRDYWLGDQVALEGLVRFSEEEIKHQELFRRIERLAAERMPAGYRFTPDANEVASAVLGVSTWAVLALTLDIELFTQLHYRESIDPDESLSPLFKDVFLYHWKEESQHALMDELEWRRADAGLTDEARDKAVDDLIWLVAAVDGILRAQAAEDARFFAETCGRALSTAERAAVEAGIRHAYRWQYIHSGAQHPRFVEVLTDLVSEAQAARIVAALATLH